MALDLADRTSDLPATTSKAAPARASTFKRPVGNRDRMFFTEQLALLIETGMPVHQALGVLEGQTTNAALAQIIRNINEALAGGQSLSFALQQYPEVFSTTYVNLVAASEGGGFMHEVLMQLLDMEEKREKLRNTLVSAFTYPAFLVSFSILVVIFVLVFVFPKFGTLFLAIEDELPITTVVLLGFSDFIIDRWPYLLAALASLTFMLMRWLPSPQGRKVVDALKVGAPLVKGVFQQLYLVQSLRVLSLSIRNGVSIVDSLHACRDVVDNHEYRAMFSGVEARVLEGGKIGDGFSASHLIPDLAKQMIVTAEEAGNLVLVTDRLAQFYQGELNRKLERLSKIIEPVMLLVMGVVVGVIVSSLILPIFKLSHAVG